MVSHRHRRDETRTRSAILALIVLLAWGALAAAWAARLDGRALDDFYITYRYARNLAEGEGLVYNPGERVYGLSEPGLGLLLGAAHRLTAVDVPLLGTAVFALSLLALGLLLLVDARPRPPDLHPAVPGRALSAGAGRRPEALLGGTLLFVWSFLWANHGSGAPSMLALLAGAAVLSRRFPLAAGALAGAASWVRPDAAAGAVLLGLLVLAETAWRERRAGWTEALRRALAPSIRFAAGAAVTGLLGAGVAWLWFGEPLPGTLEAKQTMTRAFTPGYGAADFWSSAFELGRRHAGRGWELFLALGIGGGWPLVRHGGRSGRLLVLFALVVAGTYSVLGIHLYPWYLLPVAVALVYGFAFAVGAIGRLTAGAAARVVPAVRRGLGKRLLALAAAFGLSLPVLLPLARASHRWYERFDGFGHLNTYRAAADWIRLHTPEDAAIAYVEIGVIGYRSRRPIVDLLGLVTPGSLPHVARADLPGALLARPAEIVLFHTRGRMRPILRQPWFDECYREVARMVEPEERGRNRGRAAPPAYAAVYRCEDLGSLPPPPASVPSRPNP